MSRPPHSEALWLSVSHYGAQYGANRKTVYKWIDAGLVETWRVGRLLRVRHQPPGVKPPAPAPPPSWPKAYPPAVERGRRARSRSLIRVGSAVVPEAPGVYVVRTGDAVKIGCSKRLRQRLAEMQTMFPHPLIIVGVIEQVTEHAAYALESDLHAACAADRMRGEWFRFTSQVATRLRAERAGIWDERAMQH